MAGNEDIADAWCVQSLHLTWSGNLVDAEGTYVLKHAGTDKFLSCGIDGMLTMSDR